ncbi:MAG: ArsA-related P-loop ATPase [Candidatus Binatia bacterium]
MSARVPLGAQRLVLVTGKGGVGKSAVTAALAHAAAAAGRRVLAVEVGTGRLGPIFGRDLGTEPVSIGPRLQAAAIEPEAALADFVLGVLRLKVLARRLLESTTFQVLAAAAPGLPELLVLHKLSAWLDARRLGRAVYDLVIVDAPASGHSLPLLSAPRTLGALAPIGPVADLLRRMQARLTDPAETLVCVVTTPEEFAVRETIELHHELVETLGLPVGPPIVNAMPPRRFGTADEPALARLDAATPEHPHLVAARFERTRRAEAATQVKALKRALRTAPVILPFLFAGPEDPDGFARLTEDLAQAAGLGA